MVSTRPATSNMSTIARVGEARGPHGGRWVVLAGACLAVACPEPGARNQRLAPDSTTEAAGSEATQGTSTEATEATSVEPEVVPDTNGVDAAATSVCALGCIPVSTAGLPTGIAFCQFDNGPRPTLTGGAAPDGDWVLAGIDIYPLNTFAEGIAVTFGDHGATAGRIAFGGDAMALALDLDLAVTVTAFGSSGSDTSRSLVTLGGCHEIDGARITGQLLTCADGFEAGLPPPESLDFELGQDTLSVGVELTQEMLIALLPPDQQEAGRYAIVGPLYLVASFERP